MTLLEKAKEMGLDTKGGFVFGCPWTHRLESVQRSREFCNGHTCKECYAREYVEWETNSAPNESD